MATKAPWERLGLVTLALAVAFYATLVWYSFHFYDGWFWVAVLLWLATIAVWFCAERQHAGMEKLPRGWWLNRVAAALIWLGILGFMVVPACWFVNSASTRIGIPNQLKRLALAMQNYHDANK